VTEVNANYILSQGERASHPIGQSYHHLPENWLDLGISVSLTVLGYLLATIELPYLMRRYS